MRFHATWCGPCKMVAPVVKKLSDDTGIEVRDIDIDQEPELARQYEIMGVPTIIKVDGEGTTLTRVTGAMPYQKLKDALEL